MIEVICFYFIPFLSGLYYAGQIVANAIAVVLMIIASWLHKRAKKSTTKPINCKVRISSINLSSEYNYRSEITNSNSSFIPLWWYLLTCEYIWISGFTVIKYLLCVLNSKYVAYLIGINYSKCIQKLILISIWDASGFRKSRTIIMYYMDMSPVLQQLWI